MKRKARLLLLALLLGAAPTLFFGSRNLTVWVEKEVRKLLPFEADIRLAHWCFPFGVSLEGLAMPGPPGSVNPNLLEMERMDLRVPLWGIFLRPMPVEVVLRRPHLFFDTANVEFIGGFIYERLTRGGVIPISARQIEEVEEGAGPEKTGMQPLFPKPAKKREQVEEEEEGEESEEEEQESPAAPSRLAVIALRIENGRLDFSDRSVKPTGPVFSVDHLELKVKLASPFTRPLVELKGQGKFVGDQGEEIGFTTAEALTTPTAGRSEGRVQIWYGRLTDFYRIYHYAPQPFYFEAGAGGPVIEWEIRDWIHLKVSIRSIIQGLRISGMIGDVPWQKLVEAIQDSNGRIDLTVSAEGRMDDSSFNPHDRLLSEGDWACKELAAAHGIKIPGKIFFALDHPEKPEEPEEGFETEFEE